MAPPKRKTGGRTTAPGSRSGPSTTASPAPNTARDDDLRGSGRYTAPTHHEIVASPSWVPVLMLALFILGAVAIITRYLWWDSNVPMLVGILAILGGLGVATQWK